MPSPRVPHHTRKLDPQGTGNYSDRSVPTLDELNRLFAVARSRDGSISGIPAGMWWPAFLLVILDTSLKVSDLLQIDRQAYDPTTGRLAVGLFSYELNARTADYLNRICDHAHPRLFPWPWDVRGAGRLERLAKDFGGMLKLAWISRTPKIFDTLRRQSPEVIEQLDFSLRFVDRSPPNQRKPEFRSQLHRIAFSDNLLQFFDSTYAPQRLADSPAITISDYRNTIDEFSWFLACEATYANLNEDTVERFLAWMKANGIHKNPTINKYRRNLLAVWKHAWRKRKVDDLPRDVGLLPESKRIPEAWSPEQMGRIIAAARLVDEDFGGIPANLWWPALLLTDYDTGLRIDALMQAKSTDLDLAHGWLKIPAEVQKQDADQVFQLHPDTIAAIRATNPGNRERIFAFPFLTYGPLRWRYGKILTAAGLSSGRHDLFHKIRRTSATAVCNAYDKETAQKHLGHSSVKVTERYLDPRLILPKHNTVAHSISRPVWTPSERAC